MKQQPVKCGCGGIAAILPRQCEYNISCMRCRIETKTYRTRTGAVKSWNRAMSGNSGGKKDE